MHKSDITALAIAGPIGLATKRFTQNLMAEPFEESEDGKAVYVPKEFAQHLFKAECLMEDWETVNELLERTGEISVEQDIIGDMYALLRDMDTGYRHPNRTIRISKKRLAEKVAVFYEICGLLKSEHV